MLISAGSVRMAQKRPFNDEVVIEVSSKHPRQDGPSDEIISCNDITVQGVPEKPYDTGEASIEKNKMVFQEHESGICPETAQEAVQDIESDVPRSASFFHWPTSCASDEDEPSEELIRLPFFPGYFSFDRPVRSAISPDDVYYCLLDYPPRKRVPVGPEHQAEIPGCSTQGNLNASYGFGKFEPGASYKTVEIDDAELQGICILPGPETKLPPYNDEKVGDGRTDCICPDQGSVRCIRQHIAEARDKLRKTLGQDPFMELGFCDMGEVVAEKWSEEEEQLFHEVVYSNPASLGKNFWNTLSAVFPSRTKMEIVSYYFNVFMLRKRAEQNRGDPMNVDSDNDEWQGSDDDGGDDGVISEEDEDSGVESPVRNGLEFHQNGLHGDEDGHEGVDGDISTDDARETNNNGEGYARKSDLNSAFEHPGKKSVDYGGENDVQDGSCTSSDSGAPVQGGQLKPEGCQEWHEYIVESSDAKGWDGYNMSCPISNEDFLPTCSMIEEVFGDGDFESKSKRW